LRDGLVAVLLLVVTVLAYWPAMHGTFLWDDTDHISTNKTLRSPHGLWEIWFEPGATCQYYPMTFTGFWVGYQLWGLNPLGYHLLNVLMHCLVALLLWQVLARLKVKGAWLAGAIFALHPVCVMTGAWMTELKNTLSAALALGAGWAYLRFAGLGIYERKGEGNIQHPTSNAQHLLKAFRRGGLKHWMFDVRCSMLDVFHDRCRWFYALSLGLFQLALFAKTAVSFLPVSLLLVTWWQRERLRWRDVWPLVPMLGLVVAMGRMTFYVEHLHGASGKEFNLGLRERVLISGRSFWFYLGKLFFPHQLTFIYERWQVDSGIGWQYLYPLAAAGVLIGLWWSRRRLGKGLFVALLHFYVCTSLLILLTVLYMTRYSFVSDHWQYFGCLSVIALGAAGITSALGRFENGRPFLKPALCGLLLLALAVLTWRQCRMYTDLETLWRTTLARNTRCFLAHNNLGELLAQQGQMDEAATHFQKAMQIQPDFAEAHYNFGNVLVQKGQWDEAIAQFQTTLEIQPDFAEAHNNLGNILLEKGRVDEAIAHFQTALNIQPGIALTHINLGKALFQKGQVREALAHYRSALELQPDNPAALSDLAWVLATWPDTPVRNGARAVELAEQANRRTGGQDPVILRTLAAAYAEGGRFAEAIKSAQQALKLATGQNNPGLAAALRSELELYQAGAPFRECKNLQRDAEWPTIQ
jgi:protein O-mannosyl-transferase